MHKMRELRLGKKLLVISPLILIVLGHGGESMKQMGNHTVEVTKKPLDVEVLL